MRISDRKKKAVKALSRPEEARHALQEAGARKMATSLEEARILHAPYEIAGNLGLIASRLKAAGFDATSVNYYDSWLGYQCDVNLNLTTRPEAERALAIDLFAKKAMEEYDIYHFHFLHSLYPDMRELEALKQKGRKILFSFWGSDQRSIEWILYHQAKFLGHNPPKPYFLNLQNYIGQKLANRYADVLFGLTCIPRGLKILGSADATQWTLEEKVRLQEKHPMPKRDDRVYFLHAPSDNIKKGSSLIMPLLEQCKAEGMPIEILYVSKQRPDNAKRTYAHADFAIDQVAMGSFGLFGVEMMFWEIPVLAYQTPLFDTLRNHPPVIKITKESFKAVIERCIEMKRSGERETLGKQSRQWALENADIEKMMPEYIRIYRKLLKGERVRQYVNTSWFEEEEKLKKGVKSEFYRYMNENNVFAELGLNPPEYDKKLYY